mmetsp:Transcript_7543/g.16885  ORF Transcript_7543/g.16885 Transcript_7543/m.16885 type:complete len:279 (+) Transcript_7543:520-1356(+)
MSATTTVMPIEKADGTQQQRRTRELDQSLQGSGRTPFRLSSLRHTNHYSRRALILDLRESGRNSQQELLDFGPHLELHGMDSFEIVVSCQLGCRGTISNPVDALDSDDDEEAGGGRHRHDHELDKAANVRLVAIRLKVYWADQPQALEVEVEPVAGYDADQGNLEHVRVRLEDHAALPHPDVVDFAAVGSAGNLDHLGQVGALLDDVVDVVDHRCEREEERVYGAIRQEERHIVPVFEEPEAAPLCLIAHLLKVYLVWAQARTLLGLLLGFSILQDKR